MENQQENVQNQENPSENCCIGMLKSPQFYLVIILGGVFVFLIYQSKLS